MAKHRNTQPGPRKRTKRTPQQVGVMRFHRKQKPVHAQIEGIVDRAERMNAIAPVKVSRME